MIPIFAKVFAEALSILRMDVGSRKKANFQSRFVEGGDLNTEPESIPQARLVWLT